MILTLHSDFGLSDVYVTVMKGAIAQVNPLLTVIDLTHPAPPQHMATARSHLMNAYPYFPAATVHVAVVAPGMGSQRRAIALCYGILKGWNQDPAYTCYPYGISEKSEFLSSLN